MKQGYNATTHLYNYGTMGGIWDTQDNKNSTVIVDNRGVINFGHKTLGYHFGVYKLVIKNYAMQITENQATFNGFDNSADFGNNSHLILNGGSASFADSNSKIFLDFGGDFELGKGYLFDKLIFKKTNDGHNVPSVDISRLIPRSDIYLISQSGDKFVVNLKPEHSTIGNLYKSNVRTMNNFYTMSNAMIYPYKYKSNVKRIPKRKRIIRRVKKVANLFNDSWIASYSTNTRNDEWVELLLQGGYVESRPISLLQNNSNATLSSLRDSTQRVELWQSTDSIESLESNESFAYKNNFTDSIESLESLESLESFSYKSDSNYYANNSTINQNNKNNRRITNTNQSNPSTIRNLSNDKYYFILTPFLNHSHFFESGRYNLSGLEYGFLTAFSGKLTQNNALGVHFAFSYGMLGDSNDKAFQIATMSLMTGLNYKFDFLDRMYIKARGDFYYFLNQVQNLSMPKALKPNNLGFGLSLSYSKDFDFKENGILGIEVGLDYKGLKTNTITTHNNGDSTINENFSKALYHLLYVDLGLNYNKYFNTSIGLWGINTTLGIKGNITANKLSISQIRINNLNRDVNMVLDNDKILAYANISGSYILNHKDFDMEFSLAYYGNYGDRGISNGGGVEWRTTW